ncbi:MAG: hypothetical protein HKL86_07490 [Acidimicrobiaceae bacterium]|nr:hypothetical protein [Acidimicrobiaceae bacterium]
MYWVRSKPANAASIHSAPGDTVVVAGPSSSLTIPGIVVSQIVEVMAQSHRVMRIKVDDSNDFDSELFRAPSLAVALQSSNATKVAVHVAPNQSRLRSESFSKWITNDVRAAVAFVWPGIDSSWVRQFIEVANSVGAATTVICANVPKTNPARVANLAELVADADLILVGSDADATALSSEFGLSGPIVELHSSLSLGRRAVKSSVQEIVAFLPKDGTDSLATLLAAFDAIPEAWIDRYRLEVVMRYSGSKALHMVDASYHSEFVTLVGEDISSSNLERLVSSSSALIIADPAFDSRAFLTAVECGLPIVVLSSAELAGVGRGYVGALLADLSRPVSVYVALTHALRLADLQFPRPDEWDALIVRLLGKFEAKDDPTFADSSLHGE